MIGGELLLTQQFKIESWSDRVQQLLRNPPSSPHVELRQHLDDLYDQFLQFFCGIPIARFIVNQDTTLARHSHPGGMTRAWTPCLLAMLHGVNAVAIPMPRRNLFLDRLGTGSTA